MPTRGGIEAHIPEHRKAPAAEQPTAPSRLVRRRFAGTAGLLAITALFGAWLGWHIGGAASVRDFDDAATALAALAATLACLRASSVQNSELKRFWLFLSAASAAWTIAEVIWAIYDVALRTPVPVPSWADLGYLGAIPLAVCAVLSHPAARRGGRRQARAALDGVVFATALLFLSWSFVLGPLWRHTDLSSLGGAVALAYPFGDVVMLFLVVLVIRSLERGDRFELWCVLGGLVAMAVADSTYTYMVENGTYSTGNLVDIGWVVGYLALALGAFGCDRGREVARAPVHAREAPLGSLVLPFLLVLVALVALALKVELGQELLFSDWVMALVLTLSVLARQMLALTDGMVLSQHGSSQR
ncbi:MAG TPA: hypothetical protein VME20_07055 [Acidimicrobiales bacterium]|nr:hypothetical protein [Acidimicrobiales bacterium]